MKRDNTNTSSKTKEEESEEIEKKVIDPEEEEVEEVEEVTEEKEDLKTLPNNKLPHNPLNNKYELFFVKYYLLILLISF